MPSSQVWQPPSILSQGWSLYSFLCVVCQLAHASVWICFGPSQTFILFCGIVKFSIDRMVRPIFYEKKDWCFNWMSWKMSHVLLAWLHGWSRKTVIGYSIWQELFKWSSTSAPLKKFKKVPNFYWSNALFLHCLLNTYLCSTFWCAMFH